MTRNILHVLHKNMTQINVCLRKLTISWSFAKHYIVFFNAVKKNVGKTANYFYITVPFKLPVEQPQNDYIIHIQMLICKCEYHLLICLELRSTHSNESKFVVYSKSRSFFLFNFNADRLDVDKRLPMLTCLHKVVAITEFFIERNQMEQKNEEMLIFIVRKNRGTDDRSNAV